LIEGVAQKAISYP